MIGNHTCDLAVNVMPPLFDCHDNCHEFTLMHSIVARRPSEFLAIIGHGLQAPTLILLQNTPNATVAGVSINDEALAEVRNKQHRCTAQCMLQCCERSRLWQPPLPRDLVPQQDG